MLEDPQGSWQENEGSLQRFLRILIKILMKILIEIWEDP